MTYTAKAIVRYRQLNIPALNILHAQIEDAVAADDAAERLFFAIQNSFLSRLSGQLTLERVEIVSLDDPQEGSYTPVAPVTGAIGGEALPINCAYVASKTLSGTRRKGRMFLPGVPEGGVDSGISVTVAEQAALQTQMDNFLSICTANTLPDGSPANQPGENLQLGTYSVDTPLPGANTFRSIRSFQILSRVGSQSRRRNN